MEVYILGRDKFEGNSQFWGSWNEIKYACKYLVLQRNIVESDISEFVVFLQGLNGLFIKYNGRDFLTAYDHPEYHKES